MSFFSLSAHLSPLLPGGPVCFTDRSNPGVFRSICGSPRRIPSLRIVAKKHFLANAKSD
jgi:hypothetical protein